MKKVIFFVAIVIAVVALALGVVYMIPHIPHPFIYSSHQGIIKSAHHMYAAAAFVFAMVLLGAAYLTRPNSRTGRA